MSNLVVEMIADHIVGTRTSIKEACQDLDFDYFQVNTEEFQELLKKEVLCCLNCSHWIEPEFIYRNEHTLSGQCCEFCQDETNEYY